MDNLIIEQRVTSGLSESTTLTEAPQGTSSPQGKASNRFVHPTSMANVERSKRIKVADVLTLFQDSTAGSSAETQFYSFKRKHDIIEWGALSTQERMVKESGFWPGALGTPEHEIAELPSQVYYQTYQTRLALENIRRASANVNRTFGQDHPYTNLDPSRRLPLSKSNINTVLRLAPIRNDLNITLHQSKCLRAIRRACLILSERAEGLREAEDMLDEETSVFHEVRRPGVRVSRPNIADFTIPLTVDLRDVAIMLKPENVDDELELHGTDRRTFPPPRELFHWLGKVRAAAKEMIHSFKLRSDNAGNAYRTSDPLTLLRSHCFWEEEPAEPFHWIRVLEQCWIPLAIARTASTESLNIQNYLSEWMRDQPPQIFLSKHLPNFALATHCFSTILHNCRIPGFLRLLLRLNGPFLFETRINLIGHLGTEGYPLAMALKGSNQIADALRHNLEGLRALWPFIFEVPDIDVEEIVQEWIRCPFTIICLEFISSSDPLVNDIVNLLIDFLRFLGDMMMTAHSKSLAIGLTTELTTSKSHIFPTQKGLKKISKKKKKRSSVSVFSQLKNGIGNENLSLEIQDELITLLADVLYLCIVHGVAIPQADTEDLVERLEYQNKNLIKIPKDFNVSNSDQVQKRSRKLLKFYGRVLRRQAIDLSAILSLTSYSAYDSAKQKSPLITALSPPHPWNLSGDNNRFRDYVIPCWRKGCSKMLTSISEPCESSQFLYCPQ